VTNINSQSVVSGLTDSLPAVRATCDDAVVMEPQLKQTPTSTDVSTTATEATDLTSKIGGRLQGSAVDTINAQHTLLSDILDECAIEMSSLKYTTADQSHRLGKKRRVPRGSYKKAVAKVCKKYNLERSDISMEMSLSRTKVGHKLKVNHRCTDSPMIGIEEHLLAAILRQAALRQPVYCGEGLELTNSMIEGANAHVALMEWGKNHLKTVQTTACLERLTSVTGKTFAEGTLTSSPRKRPAGLTVKEMIGVSCIFYADMYDGVYENVVQSGVIEKLDHAVW
jgi:hypothetical protein